MTSHLPEVDLNAGARYHAVGVLVLSVAAALLIGLALGVGIGLFLGRVL